MPTIGQGGTLTLSAQTDDGAGTPTDVSALTLTVLDPSSSIVSGFPVSLPTIVHDGVGQYHYNWVVGVSATIGDYTAQWQGTLNGAPISGDEEITVVLAGTVTFAPSPIWPNAYVTAERFATLGLGIDLTNVSPAAMRASLARATSAINAYCAVPRLPQRFDFRGGRMIDESHMWVIDQFERPHPFQFWPWSTPVIEVEAFSIFATNDIKVDIAAADMFINNSAGYVELSSLNLTQFGIFGAGIVPLLGLYNPVAKMTYRYGYRFPVVDEPAVSITTTVYQTENEFWTDDAVVVKVNGVTKALTTDYTIDRATGRVAFVSSPGSAVVTVSYTYSLPWEIRDACAILAAQDLGESGLLAAGLVAGVGSVRVQSGGGAAIEVRRQTASGAKASPLMLSRDPTALLDGFVFVTAR
jgi:hypothetical protein